MSPRYPRRPISTIFATRPSRSATTSAARVWIEKFEAGAFDEDQEAASLLQDYQAKIAALERKVGQLTMELDLLKKGQRFARRPRSESSSIVSGPRTVASVKDVAS